MTGQSRRRLAAGEARDGGGARDRRSGDHSGGGDHPREAQARAHPVVHAGGCGGGGARRSEARGGRRSSGEARAGAAGHGRSCGRRRWPSGRLLSAVASAGTGCGGSGHDGEGLRRRWLRPWWKRRLRCGNEGKKRGETGRCSRRTRRACRRARGRAEDGGAAKTISGDRNEDGGEAALQGLKRRVA